ncbi:DMT family transporter [Pseudomonas syringae group genomosp. 3]|uniref:Membrane protein n=1 Tax=Pseudomonas syringae pv. primulae TaxID=251707 RepID=A0A3M4SID2_9PSED|nr:DMT family transporter [Pseudomonas syringae group genomosp. 3]RMR14664.1 Membrane protein [Pseudomonas syringae pv. primulae]
MIPYLYVLAAAFLWGTSFVAGKIAFGIADAPLIVLARFAMAGLFWLPVFCRSVRSVPSSRWGALLLLSFLMIPATFLLQFMGLHYTSATSATLMIGFEPLMVMLVGWLIWREQMTALHLLLGTVALAGVLLVMGWPSGANFLGCLLVLLSTVVVAIWVRWSKIWMQSLSVNAFTALTTVPGTVMLIPFALFLTNDWQVNFSTQGAAALLYLGVGCSLGAGWLWNMGMRSIPANAGGMFLALEPIFGVIFAVALLYEPLGATTLAGIGLVVLPVLVISVLPVLQARRLPEAC